MKKINVSTSGVSAFSLNFDFWVNYYFDIEKKKHCTFKTNKHVGVQWSYFLSCSLHYKKERVFQELFTGMFFGELKMVLLWNLYF